MALALYLIFFFISFLLSFRTFVFTEAVGIISKPGCPSKCGNVSIPYPFGIGSKCSSAFWANISCHIEHDPPKPFIYTKPLIYTETDKYYGHYEFLPTYIPYEVVEFLPTDIRVKSRVASTCSCTAPNEHPIPKSSLYYLSQPYRFSPKNKITVIGCHANVKTEQTTRTDGLDIISGPTCHSTCSEQQEVINGESCTGGNGCCQTVVPNGLMELNLTVLNESIANNDFLHFSLYTNRNLKPCYSAFVVDPDDYTFKVYHLSNVSAIEEESTFLLNYNVGNKSCTDGEKDPATFACKDNSYCYEPVKGSPGYLCSCNDGYQGNPYLSGGCQDINECEEANVSLCEGQGRCTNTLGSYTCLCPHGSYGDGKKDGTGCTKRFPILQLILGVGFGIMFFVITTSWIYLSIKKRNLLKLREKFFRKNGGFQLMEQVSSQKIFTAKELEIATNNYDQHRILGQGGYGTVYKGSIAGVGDVAIKKSKFLDRSQIVEFINEVVILTQIDHRNIVKLLGCCLESEVPLLVYEFVSNGTLFHHIRKEASNMSMSWANRLRVAAEVAGALSYLHSAASTPIIHRDVKSANILLDDNLTAKVADFGTSRLNPSDQTQITTLVKGTMGYLDPEYFHTSMLTEKSDVYSFGVVLAELLTGEMPISFERSQEERNLATYFTVSVIENNLLRVLDVGLANEENTYQVSAVAELTKRCLSVKGEERPTMKEVAAELEGLRGFERHSVGVEKQCNEETVTTESTLVDLYPNSSSSYGDGTSAQYGLEMEMAAASINIPR